MDGTIYNENEIFDGTLDFLQQIKDHGGRYIFITNNSSKSVNDYVEKVTRMGIQAGFEDFYTSSQATAMYIRENYPGQTVYCMGTRSLVTELRESGLTVVTEPDENASIVLIGFDTENTSEKIRNTCIMLGRDVVYLATNPDLVPGKLRFYPGLRLHEHYAEKRHREGTILYRQARGHHGELCVENTGCPAGKTKSSWATVCIRISPPVKMLVWTLSVCSPAKPPCRI